MNVTNSNQLCLFIKIQQCHKINEQQSRASYESESMRNNNTKRVLNWKRVARKLNPLKIRMYIYECFKTEAKNTHNRIVGKNNMYVIIYRKSCMMM